MSPSPEPVSPKLKMLGPLCIARQFNHLKTNSKTLYYSICTEIKILSFYLKARQRLKEICIVKQRNSHNNCRTAQNKEKTTGSTSGVFGNIWSIGAPDASEV